ncbi:MAG: branched-chain amino acid transport system II carrier protein [Candidatus Paracaedibacteraceae bacterium]|nr:branched-chain amino acid transport system II carrier protein [Candidatus Paracaedibacteraceae bacterium]
MPSTTKLVLTAGFAMFSMFFGSGNLIFPLLIGLKSQNLYVYSILGFSITAICIPFLGLLGMMKFKGDHKKYFSILGEKLAFVLILLMLMLIGPFGVIPRCVNVAFGGLELMCPIFPLWLFSLIFCIFTGVLIWRPNNIVNIIGLILTPIKLGSYVLLIIIGIWFAEPVIYSEMSASSSFFLGLSKGYQTMDLMASFFFASTIYVYLKKALPAEKNVDDKLIRMGILSSLFGAFLLLGCYVGLVLLGYLYSPFLDNVAQESMLVAIAQQTLGRYAGPFITTTLAVSCLATATILAALFTDFLKEDICKNKITRPQAIFATAIISFTLSLFGFESICNCLGYILEWIYPFLMLFAIFQIVRKYTINQNLISRI